MGFAAKVVFIDWWQFGGGNDGFGGEKQREECSAVIAPAAGMVFCVVFVCERERASRLRCHPVGFILYEIVTRGGLLENDWLRLDFKDCIGESCGGILCLLLYAAS